MGAAPYLLLLASVVPSLVSASFAGQVPTLLNAEVASPKAKQFELRRLKQLPPSLATFQDGTARDEPTYVRGTQVEDSLNVAAELRSEPGVMHLSDLIQDRRMRRESQAGPRVSFAA